ncbi:ABC transporter permease [Subtercola lobariae]|uniref:ABC transporter permease n=1 Tax=Subtercola lobariae TaxID=1588641 RepID=UPI00166C1DB8|nr:ABC transporter permease [Subtercola lobariae]
MTTEHFSQPSIWARTWKGSRPFRPVFVVLVVVFVVLAIAQPVFASAQNLQNLLTSISVLWIVAMGMTLVLITAGADLSVAPIGALAGILLAKLLQAGIPAWLAIIISLVGGAALGGLVNGTLIGRFNVSFFVVTLGTLTAFTGIVNLWSNTESIPVNEPVILNLAVTRFLGLSGPVWIMIIIFVVTLFIQQRTFFGRDVYAVGGSISAARLSGIRVPRTIILVYAFSGLCAAIAGIVAISRIGVASPQVDANLPLQAIAAVLLGGTALSGGTGGVVGTAFGVLFIGVLSNGLSIAGVPSFWQQIVTGVILVVAVLADRIGLRRRTKSTTETSGTQPPESITAPEELAAKTSH